MQTTEHLHAARIVPAPAAPTPRTWRSSSPVFERLCFSSEWQVTCTHWVLILCLAALLSLPCILVGIPPGFDSATHTSYQYLFSHQFWGGDSYPRWLAQANKGYGSPIFLVQYPLPYFVTSVIGRILSLPASPTREARELGIYCFLILGAAGIAAWSWFRTRFTPAASVLSAALYISLPHILGQVLYARVAIGELTTFIWMPLMLAACDRIHRLRLANVCALALVFALLLVSNILYAILFLPLLIVYAVLSGRQRTLSVMLSLPLGVCTAAIYTFPLAAYRRFFDPAAFVQHHELAHWYRNLLYITLNQVMMSRIALPAIVCIAFLIAFVARHVLLEVGSRAARFAMLLTLALGAAMLIPELGPVLIRLSRVEHSGFASFADYSMATLFVAILTLSLGFLAYCRIANRHTDARDRALLAAASVSFLFMLPWAAGLWRWLPGTEVIQFPWRFCAILTVAVSGLFAAAIDDCFLDPCSVKSLLSPRTLLASALIVIGFGSVPWRIDMRVRPLETQRVEQARWVDPMYVTYLPPSELAAFARRVGTSPDSFQVAPTSVQPKVQADVVSGEGTVAVRQLSPGRLIVSTQSAEGTRVRVSQLYFPLWRVSRVVAGDIPGLRSSPDGLIELSLSPGRHDFELLFDLGWPGRWGMIITSFSLVFLFCSLAVHAVRSWLPRFKVGTLATAQPTGSLWKV